MSKGYRVQGGAAAEELSFPSLVPSDKTYKPTNNPVLQGGVSVVIGVVTLDNLVREFN